MHRQTLLKVKFEGAFNLVTEEFDKTSANNNFRFVLAVIVIVNNNKPF